MSFQLFCCLSVVGVQFASCVLFSLVSCLCFFFCVSLVFFLVRLFKTLSIFCYSSVLGSYSLLEAYQKENQKDGLQH